MPLRANSRKRRAARWAARVRRSARGAARISGREPGIRAGDGPGEAGRRVSEADAIHPIVTEVIRSIRAAIWPAVLVLALLMFHVPLSRFIERLQGVTAKRTDSGYETAFAAASPSADRPSGAASGAMVATTPRV